MLKSALNRKHKEQKHKQTIAIEIEAKKATHIVRSTGCVNVKNAETLKILINFL